jgi:AP-3 complex subunit delta-1
MFEKSLTELIKGIRAHKGSEAKYIDSAIGECRKEIKSRDLDIKARAIMKLAYVLPTAR